MSHHLVRVLGLDLSWLGVETDDVVELQQIFGPLDLSSGEECGGCKIFKIFVVGDDVDQRSWAFEVVSPNFEGFEDCE